MENKTAIFRGQPILYRVTGNGKPVVFVHGFAEDGNVWNLQVEFLQDRFRLIIPDLPGSGDSPVNSDLSTVDDYAEAIKTILDKEKIESVTLLGHSLGGYITLAFAEKYPDCLHAFGLIHSSGYPDSEEKIASRKKAIEFIHANGAYAFLKTSIPGLFSEAWSSANPSMIAELVEAGKRFSQEALVQYYHAMIARPGRTAILKNFPGPILFTMGEHDKAVPYEDSLAQSHLPAEAHIHILRHSAHMGMWEETDKTNGAILDFLSP